MTALAHWLTPELTRTAAMTILHFVWQGAALAAIAAAAMALLRSAAARYNMAVALLVCMVAAPAITFYVLHQAQVARALQSQMVSPVTVNGDAVTITVAQDLVDRAAALQQTVVPASADYLPLLVEAWLCGVLLLSLRPTAGFFALRRIRRQHAKAVSARLNERCLALQERLGITRIIRFCECVTLEAPAVIGWLCPVVYLPLSAITGLSASQLDAVIAHELAHIKRLDAFVNLFQIAAETLLFYHPAVWWLSKRIRTERENCCDDVAVAVCGDPASYAQALANMAEWQAAPVMAMAVNRHPLAARVARILGASKLRGNFGNGSLAASVFGLTASLIAGHALLGASHAAPAPPASRTSAAPVVVATPARPASAHAQTQGVVTPVADAQTAPSATITTAPATRIPNATAPAAPAALALLPTLPVAADDAAESTQQNSSDDRMAPAPPASSSYIDGLKAAGLDHLSIDQLIALKTQHVTPEYVRELHAQGLHPSVDEIIAMKVQSVGPEYIKDMRDLGIDADVNTAIAMKVQNISAEYVKVMKNLGLKADAEAAIAMKVQGVTPQYVEALRDLQLKLDVENIVALKVQGVTAEQARELKDLGLQLDGSDLIALKIQGVTPAYVRDIEALGLKLDSEKLVAMKIQGVTPEYVKAMKAAGLQLSVDDLIAAKIQGITPEFVERARSHGFKNLDLAKLMALKHSGVLD
jgi:beta-lactamase regulating signal transducer with metallopeptidase domain